jgi:hypothetical protein
MIDGTFAALRVRQIKGFVGVSGAYDLLDLHVHLNKRGMYEKYVPIRPRPNQHLQVSTACSCAHVFGWGALTPVLSPLPSRSLIRAIFTIDGHVSYRKLSPTHVVKHMRVQDWAIMPPIMLLHGSKDKTVPHQISEGFLAAIQVTATFILPPQFDGYASAAFNGVLP